MADESAADDGAVIDLWQSGVTDDEVRDTVHNVDLLARIVAAHRRLHPADPFPIVAVLLALAVRDGPLHWGHLPLVVEVLA